MYAQINKDKTTSKWIFSPNSVPQITSGWEENGKSCSIKYNCFGANMTLGTEIKKSLFFFPLSATNVTNRRSKSCILAGINDFCTEFLIRAVQPIKISKALNVCEEPIARGSWTRRPPRKNVEKSLNRQKKITLHPGPLPSVSFIWNLWGIINDTKATSAWQISFCPGAHWPALSHWACLYERWADSRGSTVVFI